MGTWVYIDGFNLYYGAVKDTPYKWSLSESCAWSLGFPWVSSTRTSIRPVGCWRTMPHLSGKFGKAC